MYRGELLTIRWRRKFLVTNSSVSSWNELDWKSVWIMHYL